MSNASVHADITAKRYGGNAVDWKVYYGWHDFMDFSKELESSNLHRIYFHHVAGIKRIMIPIFGSDYTNSQGRRINLKDCLESDHVLNDFKNAYLPTIEDYISLVSDNENDKELIKEFDKANSSFYLKYPQVRELMLYPFTSTGAVKSLLMTHNSWFVTEILPRIFKEIKIEIKDYNISPAVLFNRMSWVDWVDNGRGKVGPPSFQKIQENRQKRIDKARPKPEISAAEITYDGARKRSGLGLID
jgi:hypothetical protein